MTGKILKTIVTVVFFLNSLFLHAVVDVLKTVPLLPVYNLEADSICFPAGGDTVTFNRFFQKLDHLNHSGAGRVNILHIGGSHIQAGTLSNRIRQNFAAIFPTANRDMIFPFSAAKTNNPSNYTTTYTGDWTVARNIQHIPSYSLGLTGMCIGTADTAASIGIKRNDYSASFSSVYVLGNNNSSLEPCLTVADSVYNGVYDTIQQAFYFHLDCLADAFTLTFRSKPDAERRDFQLRGFWLDNTLPGISYVDIGVNGASVPAYLRCPLLEQDLALIQPDLCILSIGINDASGREFDTVAFQNNYKKLIHRIHSVAPQCEILFTTNNDSYRRVNKRYYNNKNGLLAQQAFFSLANYYHAGVWDLFGLMGGLGSMQQWEAYGLSRRDKIHFTPQGYTLLGDLVYNALMRDYIKHSHSTVEQLYVE
ncbi:MAG: GDSL-type esterase/lipase family protein [Prevotellaceae bacterium]|jgi:lysophospholipase L1-like esterase|nr:GDSL-type esterase/lipase family protein [Prevotellaceae bacterium]